MNAFNRERIFQLIMEGLWLALTGVVIYAVLYPITSRIEFIYVKSCAFFIFVTITYFRYSVMFKSVPFLRPAWLRFVLFTGNIVLFFALMHYEQKFLSLYENFYVEDFGFPKVIMYEEVKQSLFKYLYKVIVLFGTGSLVMIIGFQCRLILSYWQYYKHQADTLMES